MNVEPQIILGKEVQDPANTW